MLQNDTSGIQHVQNQQYNDDCKVQHLNHRSYNDTFEFQYVIHASWNDTAGLHVVLFSNAVLVVHWHSELVALKPTDDQIRWILYIYIYIYIYILKFKNTTIIDERGCNLTSKPLIIDGRDANLRKIINNKYRHMCQIHETVFKIQLFGICMSNPRVPLKWCSPCSPLTIQI